MERLGIYFLLVVTWISVAFCFTRQRRAADPENIPLSDTEKMEIVQLHNDLRRSSGSSNMRYMTWDSELAWLAENYGKQCQYKHNSERVHSKYASVGENIYAGNIPLSSFTVTRPVQLWFDEITDFDFNSRTCVPGKLCGHYTQVVWATSFKVGCALTTCDYLSQISLSNALLFVCNYATAGNIVYASNHALMPVFQKGGACSDCDAGDYCRNSLCANSARDFIEEPDTSDDIAGNAIIGLIISVAVLSLIVILLVAFIIYREKRRSSVRRDKLKKRTETSHAYSKPEPTKENNRNEEAAEQYLFPRLKTEDNVHSVQDEHTSGQGQRKRIPAPPKIPPPFPPPPPIKRY